MPFPFPGDPPDPGMEPTSFTSPALAGRFFTTGATWEALSNKHLLKTSWLPRWHSGKEYTCQRRRCKRHGFSFWVERMPWRRNWQPTPVLLPGEFHGQSNLVGYSSWGHKDSDTTEHMDMTEHTQTHTLNMFKRGFMFVCFFIKSPPLVIFCI